jgi:wyosine [tRNA(Phe)-imidazoG37] synthetase (radical SAM superfamily)
MKTPWTWFPTLEVLGRDSEREFSDTGLAGTPSLDTITFSGNGEPTLYPEFPPRSI